MKALRILQNGLVAGAVAATLAMTATAAVAAPTKGKIDVLNWWTSGSEAKSMGVLQKMMAKEDYKMVNDAVAGGGGANAMTVLKSRVQSQSLPGAAQIKGPHIQQWCQTGLTSNIIDSVAKKDHWNKVIAPVIAKGLKCKGHWAAVPFNIHRINWLWINRSLLKKAGAKIPKTWDQLVATLKKLKKAGITPLAGGGNTWQVATEFDAVVAATGNADFYRKAFVKLDPKALSSATMVKSFKRLRTLKKYTDPNGVGLSWNHDSDMVVHGKAAMQIMGDWAKGEITLAHETPGKEVACVALPGSQDVYVYNIDSFVMFKAKSSKEKAAQKAFARTALSPKFQRLFNKAKGSIPVREGVSLKGFDPCAHKSKKAYLQVKKSGGLVPSMSQSMAETAGIMGSIFDVVAQFYNNDNMTPEAAAQELAQRVKQAKMLSKL